MAQFEDNTSRLEAFISSPIGRAWRKTWNDYSNVSSVHGMKYIYDKDANIFIRVAWAVTILVMFTLANRMAYSLYVDFIIDPIRLIIESDHTNTAKLLYPVVTVCPTKLFNHSKAKELILNFTLPENLSADEVVQNLDQTYGFIKGGFMYNKAKISTLQTVMEFNNYTAEQFLKKIYWDFDKLFFRCRFQSKYRNCSDIFRVSKTFAGICYSFNSHQSRIPSTQYKSNRHAMRRGLSFILKSMELDSHSNAIWFQILIHEAHVYPDELIFRKLLQRNQEVFIRTAPTETMCSREVWRRLTIHERKCALRREKKLRFFEEYHQQNCVIECRIIIMQKVCGCVPFFLFRETNTLVCEFKHIPCLSDNYERMLSMQKECKCVDGCEKVDFSVRLTSTEVKNTVDVVDPF